MDGLIRKALGGFYYVETSDGVLYECHARGIFRKEGVTPLVGDKVEIETSGDGTGTVCDIYPRKNEILRPPLANLDRLFLVTSIKNPKPNLFVMDKFLAMCAFKEIDPVIIVTKNDLGETETLSKLYSDAGFSVLSVNYHDQSCVDAVKKLMAGKVTAFTGNTGAGKSSLLNLLYPQWDIKTAQISKKLGRGKHTTRHVELYPLEDITGYVADTPGFSTMDLMRYDVIHKEDLQYCFREFEPYLERCQFTGCSHTVEKGCAVLEALKAKKIAGSRHESYCALYDEAKQVKEWER